MSAALLYRPETEHDEAPVSDELVTVYAWASDGDVEAHDFIASEVLDAIRDSYVLSDGTPTASLTRIEVVIPEPGSDQAYGWGWRR